MFDKIALLTKIVELNAARVFWKLRCDQISYNRDWYKTRMNIVETWLGLGKNYDRYDLAAMLEKKIRAEVELAKKAWELEQLSDH